MGGGGGTKVEAPKPSEEELALRREQTALAQQQRQIIEETMRQQNLLQPILMENQGYRPVYSQVDPNAVARAGEIDARISTLHDMMARSRASQSMSNEWVFAGNEIDTGNALWVNKRTGEYWNPNQPGGYQSRPGAVANAQQADPAWQQEIDRLNAERGTLGDRLTGGRITGYELLPEVAAQQQRLRELQTQQNEITGMMQERTLKALRGELPVDPAIERWITEGRATLADQLRANLGTGFETSTPGIQALADFDKRANEIRSAAQRDAIYNTNQLQMAGQQYSSNLEQMRLSNVTNLNQLGLGGAQGLAASSQMLQGPLSGYMQDRNMAFQAAVNNAQQANRPSGLGSTLGSIVGAGAGFFLGGGVPGMALGASIGGGAGGSIF